MSLKSFGQSLATAARHFVPLGGLFGRDWHPVTALAVYWIESVLLAVGAAFLCLLLQRRISTAADDIEHARREGDMQGAALLERERHEVARANIKPGDVFGFHVGSLLVFGMFLGGVTFIAFENGHLAEPMRWGELRDGAWAIAVVIAISVLFDLWRFDRMTPAAVQSRVDACLTRWVLLWLLGFFGAILIGITGRATVFFGFFAVLKVLFESWATLARVLGFRSVQDRRSVYDSPTP